MTTWTLLSALVILASPSVIGGYDLVAYLVSGNDATISRLSQRTAWEFPPYQWSICFLFGLLCGHLFTTRPDDPVVPRAVSLLAFVAVPYAVVIATMVLGLVSARLPLTETTRTYPLGAVLAALTLGAVVGSHLLHQTGD